MLALPGARDAIAESDGVRVYRLRGPTVPTQTQYRFMIAMRSMRRLVVHERPDVIEARGGLTDAEKTLLEGVDPVSYPSFFADGGPSGR